jgi:hypothetical protein
MFKQTKEIENEKVQTITAHGNLDGCHIIHLFLRGGWQ